MQGHNIPITNRMHEYYTPKPTKLQGISVFFTLFVNYANIYVNRVMSTFETKDQSAFTISDYFAISRASNRAYALNIVICKFSCKTGTAGEEMRPAVPFCTS